MFALASLEKLKESLSFVYSKNSNTLKNMLVNSSAYSLTDNWRFGLSLRGVAVSCNRQFSNKSLWSLSYEKIRLFMSIEYTSMDESMLH